MQNLIKIQSELKCEKSQYNSFGKYKYRSTEDILESLKPLLLKHKCTLTISDKLKSKGNYMYVESKCMIKSGEESITVKAQAGINPDRKGMDIAQSFGASSSYARKYALSGLFLIDDSKDADTQKPPLGPVKKVTPNVQTIPYEITNGVSLDLENAKDVDSLTELFKKHKATISKYPSIKAMFTAKKMKLQKSA